jgi:hypothetical protein
MSPIEQVQNSIGLTLAGSGAINQDAKIATVVSNIVD